uniref:FP protein C-terminal domain-containing protein n=1 Tax=Cacopsylla melanoneura TaxID=428564 RepID=A0A8D9BE00_9HEMI
MSGNKAKGKVGSQIEKKSPKKTDRQILEELVQKMDEMMQVNKEMKEKISSLEKEVRGKDDMIFRLEGRIETLEQRSRMSNVIVRGIEEKKGEDCMGVIKELGQNIGISVQDLELEIQTCHRVPSRNKKAPRPIVVRLCNTKTRDKWVRAAKAAETWKGKLYVHEHLTPSRQHLFHQTKEMSKKMQYKYVWTRDCKILMKKGDSGPTLVIKSSNDLHEIAKKNGRSFVLPRFQDQDEAEDTFSM